MGLILKAIKSKQKELSMSLLMVMVLLLISSVLMYFIENPHQPDAFSGIAASMWWGCLLYTSPSPRD